VSCSESVKQQTDGRTTRREGRHPLLKSMLVRNCIDWTVHIPKTSTPKTEAPIVQYRSSLAHHSTSPNHSPSPSIIPISPVPFTTIIIAHMKLTSKYSPLPPGGRENKFIEIFHLCLVIKVQDLGLFPEEKRLGCGLIRCHALWITSSPVGVGVCL